MINNKRVLTGLEHQQYEHPLDKAALEKLEKVPFLPAACKWVTSNFVERVYNIQYTGSNLKVTQENYPQIYEYLEMLVAFWICLMFLNYTSRGIMV